MAGLAPAWMIILATLLLTTVEAKVEVLTKVLAIVNTTGATRLVQ